MRVMQRLLVIRTLLCELGTVAPLSTPIAFGLPSPAHMLQWVAGIKKQANELRVGHVIEHNGKLLQIVSLQNRAMGRQLGNVNFELRDVITKQKHPAKFRPSDMVESVRLEARKFQCLYTEGSSVHCMEPQTFEQLIVERDLFGEGAAFLGEGVELTLSFYDDEAVTGEVPAHVTLRVTEAAPSMKGETAAPSYKRAQCGDIEVQVPPFVQPGDAIIVNTLDRSFVRRADK